MCCMVGSGGTFIFYGWGGGGWGGSFWVGHPKIFELKEGSSQKLRGKRGHAGKCTGLRGHPREKLGVMQNFSEIIKTLPLPYP